MNRRKFLTGMMVLPVLPVLLKSCDWSVGNHNFPISIHSDRKTGHLIFESNQFQEGKSVSVETLVVGGGIAGLSAALSLPHQDFLLCELSDRLGGTSASHNFNGLPLAQGAHYDLEYPDYYGTSPLGLLEKIDVIKYQPWKQSWGFKDEQYIIPHSIKNQCYDHGQIRGDVLPDGEMKDSFSRLVQQYAGKMPMPTSQISEELHYLDKLTFKTFLQKELTLSEEFYRGLDYHMLDDWGGTSDQVSAIAGIHYFQCRPYYNEVNELFSPPQGNDYFVSKIVTQLPKEQLLKKHLVKSVKKLGDKWISEVIDVENKTLKRVTSNNVIYAGQKHALKYVMPDKYSLFQDNEYAPWLVLNFVLKDPIKSFGFWQNEMIVEDQSFLGFINSAAQHSELQEKQVLTAYYCLPSSSRKFLANVDENRNAIVSKTIDYLNSYHSTKLDSRIEAVFMNAMGHAMPIPKTNYLFKDKSIQTRKEGLAFAGVDHSRLPLLFEAIDSGLSGVNALYPN